MKANREDLLIKLESLHKSYMLCESHFEDRMFVNHLHSLEGGSSSAMEDHSYATPMLLPAKIRVLDNRVLVPGVTHANQGM